MRFLIGVSLVASSAFAAPHKGKPVEQGKKNLSFDSQVVEGEIYRPDYSVVTGQAPGQGWGVLRLRANFNDHVQTDSEENQR